MQPLYTATATARGGRNGKVVSDDGTLNLDVRMPKALGGAGGNATNPEQLFAAGYAACFDSALNLMIRMKRIQVTRDGSNGTCIHWKRGRRGLSAGGKTGCKSTWCRISRCKRAG
ncbi:peroxiredoxin, Ohr subfamily [Lihuaxuella thermophila]|uniref:Peroxiredoxin, Ohr subfamily n=1 Tax=Lihuaxuella thermophila TaxID=1173111 RepID=A0A1H8IAZ7_9BACL|nr:peroxiredoxin, Ohr subfamily [Lihuaxuella thermophila]